MVRKFGRYSRLLFRLFLLFQLYSYHNLKVSAIPTRQDILEIYDDGYHQNGSDFGEESERRKLQRTKRPSRLLPANQKEKKGTKNQTVGETRFYGPASNCVEISKLGYTLNGYYLVKGKSQTKYDKVEVLDCRFKHPNGFKKEKMGFIDIEVTKSVKRRSQGPFEEISLEAIEHVDADRPKRPVRLLPRKMFLKKPKNNTENDSETRFYGPATSCEELGKLGYTLNGLYLVDCEDKSKKGKIEIIECRFKQPQVSKEAKEERIGFVNVEVKKTKTVQRRQLNALRESKSALFTGRNRIQRPIRLLPPHILYGKEKDDIEVVERFYGPPKSCSELGKLGYTLNGYYLVNGTASSHPIEISLCKFHQPIGSTESLKEEGLVLVPKPKYKRYELLYLNHGRNKSYPFMNIKSGKCLDADENSVVIEADCNPSTAKHWKMLNDGKQLCDTNSDPKCVSVKVDIGKKGPSSPPFDQMLHLAQFFVRKMERKTAKIAGCNSISHNT